MAEEERDVVIERPNRDKASSKATKAVIILLLLVSVALIAIVTIGGWDALEGAKFLQIAYIIIYLVMAFYTGRWNRGVLPLAAALAIILGIFAGRDLGTRLVRSRQDRLHGPGAVGRPARTRDPVDRPGPGPADRFLHARLPAGLERRGGGPARRVHAGPRPARDRLVLST